MNVKKTLLSHQGPTSVGADFVGNFRSAEEQIELFDRYEWASCHGVRCMHRANLYCLENTFLFFCWNDLCAKG